MACPLPPQAAPTSSNPRPRLVVLLPLLLVNSHALVTRRGSRQGHWCRPQRRLRRPRHDRREHRPELGCLPPLLVRWKHLACLLDLLQQPAKRVGAAAAREAA